MKKLILAFIFLHSSFFISNAQPGREMRGTWFTTAWRIDWPPTGSAQTQQNKMISMFNQLEAANINAIFFQVRPFADAFYNSAYEPWSHMLGSSAADRGVYPGYDPLALAIREAHKRGMELHVWLNPYRFEVSAGEFAGRPGDYSQTHPHLIITYNGRTYFDPGHPETTQLIKNIIADIISKYDIDGVIFDDYFYPSNMPNSYDQDTYDTYGTVEFISQYYSGPLFQTYTRGDFRRASVNNMIREVNDTIKAMNPTLVFGVSPAGIYTTNALVAEYYETTLPEGITGNNNWATINCDPLAWLKEGTVDYISPQLYWQIGGNQDFVTLTEWWGWQAQRYGRHHYPSLGAYRIYPAKFDDVLFDAKSFIDFELGLVNAKINPDKNDWPVTEIGNQIIANRQSPYNDGLGLIFYNTNSFLRPDKDLAGYLAGDLFSEKTVFPLISWVDSPEPEIPAILNIGTLAEDPEIAILNIDSDANQFIVYGWNEPPLPTKEAGADFVQVAFKNQFSTMLHRDYPYFAVAEFTGNHTIGPASDHVVFSPFDSPDISLYNGGPACQGDEISWAEMPGIGEYQVLLFPNPFDYRVVFQSQIFQENFFPINRNTFPGQQTFYYRIMARNGVLSSYSELDSFSTGYPSTPGVNSPEEGEENVSFSTVAQWSFLPEATSYELQVATDPAFSEETMVINETGITQNILNISLNDANTQHYLRVAGVNDCGAGSWSPVISFTTTSGVFVETPPHQVLGSFPNPSSDRTFIPYPNAPGKRRISLYNTSGQRVLLLDKNDSSQLDEIDISGLLPGFYTGMVTTAANNQFIFKLIKIKP